ncbi:MAG: carbon storage regulator CsrA [Candidatus Nanopelagicales bacterium]|nr:carbon storage regulator CsrA [Candidatus Nanopelagicales bacterium]
MLVLSRKVGESIVIGDDVVVTILEIRGDLIRVGIDAPKRVKVHRSEVFEAIEAANKEAVAPTLEAMSEFASAIKDLPVLPKNKDPE